jgi:hypothetical protein
MKNINYTTRTFKYQAIAPCLIVLSWFLLLFYRTYYLNLDWFSAFINVIYWVISPLTLIFWWIVLFFIVLSIQSFNKKLDWLDEKWKQKELRNELVKRFYNTEKSERRNIYFYLIVWLLSLTAYVLLASSSEENAKTLILFWIIWVLVPLVQAVKLYKYVKNNKLKVLKEFWDLNVGKISQIKKKWKWFLRGDDMRYQILARLDNWDMIYKSSITRFNLPNFLSEWDRINIYTLQGDNKEYYVDIESAFIYGEDDKDS